MERDHCPECGRLTYLVPFFCRQCEQDTQAGLDNAYAEGMQRADHERMSQEDLERKQNRLHGWLNNDHDSNYSETWDDSEGHDVLD
jgi:hypothetical protein